MASEIQNIYLESTILSGMRKDANEVLQRLIKTMSEKGSMSGEMTIKIKIEYVPEFISDGKNGSRKALKPMFEHAISSKMEVKDSKKGAEYDELREVVYDAESDRYVLKPIKGSEQMSIFDFTDDADQSEGNGHPEDSAEDSLAADAPIPDPAMAQISQFDEGGEVIDGEYKEVDAGEENADAADAGEKYPDDDIEDTPFTDPADAEAFPEYDDYEYEEGDLIDDNETEVTWK